ncbi:MAG: thioredoxin family protein [Clostridium sp.]|uniref:thioredoxin family protein n=1 Tax=Clostridium sp. TaxID=1506 RepID=UPI002FC9028E
MKKKYLIIVTAVILAIIIGVVLFMSINKKDKYEAIKYGRAEFVTSMNDINKELPTVILFKSSMVENSLYAERNLKYLHDDYGDQFNIVHANADDIQNKEIVALAEKYNVVGVPTIVVLNKDGNLVDKKEDISSKEEIAEMLKKVGVKINN